MGCPTPVPGGQLFISQQEFVVITPMPQSQPLGLIGLPLLINKHSQWLHLRIRTIQEKVNMSVKVRVWPGRMLRRFTLDTPSYQI